MSTGGRGASGGAAGASKRRGGRTALGAGGTGGENTRPRGGVGGMEAWAWAATQSGCLCEDRSGAKISRSVHGRTNIRKRGRGDGRAQEAQQ